MVERKDARIHTSCTRPSSSPLVSVRWTLALQRISATGHGTAGEHQFQVTLLIAGHKFVNRLQLQGPSIVLTFRKVHFVVADYPLVQLVLALQPLYHIHTRRTLLRKYSLISKKASGLPAKVRHSQLADQALAGLM